MSDQSTHHVHRGAESLPCYCGATSDHQIGEEQVSRGEALARRFHEAYERLAPSFGYETRAETRQFDPTTPNGRLMIAVCAEITGTSGAIPEPWDECFSSDGDTWCDSPEEAGFVDGLSVGDTYELTVSHWSVRRTYVVTKVPDETSDDYEVMPVPVTP